MATEATHEELLQQWAEAQLKYLFAEDRMRRLEAARYAVEAAVRLHCAEKDEIDKENEAPWIVGPMHFTENWGYAEMNAQHTAHMLALTMNREGGSDG